MKPIFLKPTLHHKIWGGEKLQTIFNLEIPSKTTGEAWCISAHKGGLSTVISPKEYEGVTLDELYANHRYLFGGEEGSVFPLLVKIIDAKDNLSVQVHPDDDYAQKNEGELGKNECWYIVDAKEDAKIVYGHNAKNKEEFKAMVEKGDWKNLLREVKVKAGDFFDVPSGTIHAIGGGIVILETQQSSDTTYRVFDYDRVGDDGKARPLHLKESFDVTAYEDVKVEGNLKKIYVDNSCITNFVNNKYFSVSKWDVKGELKLKLASKYTLATVINGRGNLIIKDETYPIKIADSFILPYGISDIKIEGDIEIMTSHT